MPSRVPTAAARGRGILAEASGAATKTSGGVRRAPCGSMHCQRIQPLRGR